MNADVSDLAGFLQLSQESLQAGDYNQARIWLQKAAYISVKPTIPQNLKDSVKRAMTAFAAEDQLYLRVSPLLLDGVRQAPGVLQSDFTAGQDEQTAEAFRYVFYFAAELGQLIRVKKGRSYQLYLPEHAPS